MGLHPDPGKFHPEAQLRVQEGLKPMKAILKYELSNSLGQNQLLPNGKVLLVAQQHGQDLPTIWLECGTEDVLVTYYIYATGAAIHQNSNVEHVGSAVCGFFVWHIYRDKSLASS